MNTQDNLITVPPTLGIGWLEITADYPIPIYKNMTDSLPYDILKFKIRKPLFIHNTNQWKVVFKTKINLKPNSIGWANGRTLIFRVVDSADDLYRIVTNEETFETCYIKINEYRAYNHDKLVNVNPYIFVYQYETWLDYLTWSHKYIEKKNIVIYDKPNGNIIFENEKDRFLPFRVTDMDGDWIKLEKMTGYGNIYGDFINHDSWTQWKEGEKLLIQIEEVGLE